jgi:alkanesulfonate monooxygenase SsuD/methylene tetrahydromethanopterin reductase-like flavin-dependent oxidoreductase (luciferase family)
MTTSDTAASPRLGMTTGNKLKLGLFGSNCSGGRALTRVPERWKAEWDENAEMAVMADAAGIDFLLPIGRWKGYGGETDWQGTSFETITWATGLLALTKQITVFGTVHVPLFHPISAAKQMVTADHVGHGRFGLNIVAGWNEQEFAMFGVQQKERTKSYEQAQEWIDAVSQIWTRDDFDFKGEYYQLDAVRVKPKPYGGTRPVIMNAGASGDGQAFAIRNCDAYFTGVRMSSFDEESGVMVPAVEQAREHVDAVRAKAAAIGREIGVFTRAEITCRPTQKEAAEYYRYWVEEMADWDAIDYQMKISTRTSITPDQPGYIEARKQHIHGFPLVGDPDRVASMLATLSEAGFDGVGLSFVDYLGELPYFRDEVLPRLERLGLRRSVI